MDRCERGCCQRAWNGSLSRNGQSLLIEERKLTQTEAADLLGVKQPEISRLKNGKFNHYSVARLMTFLNRLNRDIEIRIIPSKDRKGQQRVVAV